VLRLTPKEQVLKGDVFDAEKALYTFVELMINGTYGSFIQAASTGMQGEFQMAPVNKEHITNQLS
jgi:hypothetical protein